MDNLPIHIIPSRQENGEAELMADSDEEEDEEEARPSASAATAPKPAEYVPRTHNSDNYNNYSVFTLDGFLRKLFSPAVLCTYICI